MSLESYAHGTKTDSGRPQHEELQPQSTGMCRRTPSWPGAQVLSRSARRACSPGHLVLVRSHAVPRRTSASQPRRGTPPRPPIRCHRRPQAEVRQLVAAGPPGTFGVFCREEGQRPCGSGTGGDSRESDLVLGYSFH